MKTTPSLPEISLARTALFFITSCLFAAGCGSSGSKKETADTSSGSPNIIYIISDDQSWTDYSFTGHPHIQTPHIDSLARQGRAFTRGYSVAPLCSPSLASLITGVYPQQHGITGNDPKFDFEGKRYGKEWRAARAERYRPWLEKFDQFPTVPDLLAEKGYVSFQAGKWWGGSWKDGGFTAGMTHGDPARSGRHGDRGLRIGREGMQPVFNFIDSASAREKPFFLWYAPFLPHSPHTPPDSLLQKYIDKAPSEAIARYWAMCEWFDVTIGQLLGHLEAQGLAENTMIVYACDNGWIQDPEKANAYLPGSKRDPEEMGIRTPIIVKWPGKVQPGLDSTTLVSTIDIVPTVLAAANVSPTAEMPGLNLLNEDALQQRKAIFAVDFSHDMVAVDDPAASLQHRIIITNPWKLIVPDSLNGKTKSARLYNVYTDPYERHDLAAEHPGIVSQLQQQLDAWWKDE